MTIFFNFIHGFYHQIIILSVIHNRDQNLWHGIWQMVIFSTFIYNILSVYSTAAFFEFRLHSYLFLKNMLKIYYYWPYLSFNIKHSTNLQKFFCKCVLECQLSNDIKL